MGEESGPGGGGGGGSALGRGAACVSRTPGPPAAPGVFEPVRYTTPQLVSHRVRRDATSSQYSQRVQWCDPFLEGPLYK